MLGDDAQGVVVGDQLLEVEPSVEPRRGVWHHQHSDCTRISLIAGHLDGADARDLWRGFVGELLVVLGGDGPVPGPQEDRTADLGRIDRLRVHPTDGRRPVLDSADERNGLSRAPRSGPARRCRGSHHRRGRTRTRMGAPLGGMAPKRRSEPSGSRTAGPNPSSPVRASSAKCVSSDADSEKSSTWVHGSHPDPEATSSTTGSSLDRTGVRCSTKRWPGTPSDMPTTSSVTRSACMAATVPPTVAALTDMMRGLAE